jgi:hypothetical protein
VYVKETTGNTAYIAASGSDGVTYSGHGSVAVGSTTQWQREVVLHASCLACEVAGQLDDVRSDCRCIWQSSHCSVYVEEVM